MLRSDLGAGSREELEREMEIVDDSRVTTTDGGNSQSSPYLDQAAIDAALIYVTDNWPHQQMTPAQQDAWLDILCQLKPGELKPALRRLAGRFRPDAYVVLEAVLASRPAARHPDFAPKAEYQRTDTCSQAAERVFSTWAHLMPSRRNQVSA